MQHNHAESVSFLRTYCPEGPWVITAIRLDKSALPTKTFFPTDSDNKILEWLGEHRNDNIYFHLNVPSRPLTSKAKKTDIKELRWLQVDIDPGRPPAKCDDVPGFLSSEQDRILNLLRDLPGGIPEPTIVLFSGGGYQAFWLLVDPVEIRGDAGRAEDVERYSKQLASELGGDHCHSIDHVFRLPGTVNWPTEKKISVGRTPALSRIVRMDMGKSYPLRSFRAAVDVQSGPSSMLSAPRETVKVSVSGNIDRLNDVDDLDGLCSDEVKPWLKVLIIQGCDPDDPSRYASRSEAVFAVSCALARAGASDDVIYSVLTDPQFAISDSVLGAKGGPKRYAVRQIERAREAAVDPNLERMNSRYAVIGSMGGKCVVIEEIYDEQTERSRLSPQDFTNFKHRTMADYVDVPAPTGDDPERTKKIGIGTWWLTHPKRRQYDYITFAPGKETPGRYNLWRGFGCEARPGNCELFLSHLRDNVCCGNESHYEYLMDWMANTVQRPGKPGQVAVVLQGGQGIGKSFFVRVFGHLFGRHYMQVTNADQITGKFNGHLRDCVLLFADEAFFAGNHAQSKSLKGLVTEDMMAVENKGKDVEFGANCLHIIMASNSKWIVPAEADERRYFVLKVSEAQKRNSAYFEKIENQMKSGGYEALLSTLLQRDMKDKNVRDVPDTDALQDQKVMSYAPHEAWWYEKLRDGKILEIADTWDMAVPRVLLREDYRNFCPNRIKMLHPNELGKFINGVCPGGTRVQQMTPSLHDEHGRPEGSRVYHTRPPSLDVCRKWWDENMGGPFEWPDDDTEGEEIPF